MSANHALSCSRYAFAGLIVAITISLLGVQARAEDDSSGPSSAARLKFLQKILQEMRIDSTQTSDTRELKFQLSPLLRYNDAPRSIADSVVFRLGTQGRPIAIVTCELYGGGGRQFTLNHEFLAIDDPHARVNRDGFIWAPPTGTGVRFQNLESDQPPASTARARLSQIKQLTNRFSARETWNGSQIELRILPTPLDRYVPSDKPNADGVIFAFTQGVNPEALLLLETEGEKWSFGWARLGKAKIVAKLDDNQVWEVQQGILDNDTTAGYTAIQRNVVIPVELEADVKSNPPVQKSDTKQ